jgi:hypothetical protein
MADGSVGADNAVLALRESAATPSALRRRCVDCPILGMERFGRRRGSGALIWRQPVERYSSSDQKERSEEAS